MKTINIIVIGGIGTAHNIVDQILDAEKNYHMDIHFKGIIIDTDKSSEPCTGLPIIGTRNEISRLLNDKQIQFIFALYKPGRMKERYKLMESLAIPRERFFNFIHPLAYKSASSKMGFGNVILSNSTIQSNVTIGDMNIINSNVTLEHDTSIGNGNFLAANACIGSKVKLGDHCFIGLNSSVRENVTLGDEVFIGMHSLVLKDIYSGTYAGVPSRPIRK